VPQKHCSWWNVSVPRRFLDTPPDSKSAIFQAGGLVVLVVEVFRKAYLAALVPVLVNAILNEHQLVVDIITFVSKGDFPRSRLGEKQRGKVLASWVTRKLINIAQFAIRDSDVTDTQIAEVNEPASHPRSTGNGSTATSSLRHNSSFLGAVKQHQPQEPPQHYAEPQFPDHYASIPTGISEMPTNYDESIVEAPAGIDDNTPTNARGSHFELPDNYTYPAPSRDEYQADGASESSQATQNASHLQAPTVNLPPVSGHEGLMDVSNPSGLEVANKSSSDEGDWPQEAIMHMNLAGPSHDGSNRASILPSPSGRESGQY
jgi:hypothetical protein